MDAIEQEYRRRIDEAEAECAALRRTDARCTLVRGVGLVALLFVGFLKWHGVCSAWWLLVPVAAIIVAARGNERAQERLEIASTLAAMRRRQLARRGRRWDELPAPATPETHDDPHVARDLDVFGPRSVFQWLCLARTPFGRETLAVWLMRPADVATIRERQRTVQALAGEGAWRESLELHANLLGDAATAGREFAAWGRAAGWLASRPGLRWYARLAPLAGVVAAIAFAAGRIEATVAIGALVVLLLANLVVAVLFTGDVHDLFDRVARRGDEVEHYGGMLTVAAGLPESAGPCHAGGRDLREIAAEGLHGLRLLHRVMAIANLRRSGLGAVVVLVLHAVMLWELHVLDALEVWQRRFGPRVAEWLDVIGRLEAFNSLAAVAHDQPDWCYPEIVDDASTFAAEGLGHPLLANERRTTNDVTVGPAGTVLLVTGSNMSGKSTLLRAIGVNLLLARAGGPTCARKLRAPPVEVQTSMRVADSLADGVSFFFAELLRLKEVVERARRAREHGGRLLYLLDEILQGTNSRERQVAVLHVIRHLLDHGALGAVSTHDLELAVRPELAASCRPVHFRETIERDGERRTMTFDYRLREGVCPTTNALVLLDLVGLGDGEAGGA